MESKNDVFTRNEAEKRGFSPKTVVNKLTDEHWLIFLIILVQILFLLPSALHANTEDAAANAAAEAVASEVLYEKTVGTSSSTIAVEGLNLDLVYGSLRSSVEVKVSKNPTPEKWGSFIRVSDAYLVGPSETILNKPMWTRIKYDDRLLPPGKVESEIVIMASRAGVRWEAIGGDVRADYSVKLLRRHPRLDLRRPFIWV